jgi:hypothetical protein
VSFGFSTTAPPTGGNAALPGFKAGTPNLIVVHAPVHASWLNQIEIYFSILQRKLLTPNDFKSLKDLQQHLMEFQNYYEQIAKPFEWKFTRQDLTALLNKLKPASLTIERLAA